MSELLAHQKPIDEDKTTKLVEEEKDYIEPIPDKDRVEAIYYKNALIKRHATERPCLEKSFYFSDNQVQEIQRLLDETTEWTLT